MRLKVLVASCAAALAAAFALAGCSSQEPYTPPESTPTVSSPAIGEDGVLRVGVDASSAPLAGQNSSGDLVGFDVDLAAALADELGLKVEVTDVGTSGAASLSNGDVDIVLGVQRDTSSADVWESEPYLETAVALFAADANEQVPTIDSAPKIAVQTSSNSSWLAENEFGADALVRTNSLAEAFEALGSGEAGFVAADAVRGTYALTDGDLNVTASVIALMQQPSGYCVALLDSNAQLKQAVADALSTLTDGGVISVLDRKWLGTDWDLSSVPLTAGATTATADDTAAGSDDNTATDASAEGDAAAASGETGTNALSPADVAAA